MHAPNMESKPLQEFDYFLVPYFFCLFLFLSEPSELWTWGNTTDGAAWSAMQIRSRGRVGQSGRSRDDLAG